MSGNRRGENTGTDRVFAQDSIAKASDVTKRCDKLQALGSRHSINNIAESNANLISPHRCWQPVSNVGPTVPCALSVAQTGFACNQNQPGGKRSKKEFRWDRAGETL
jgi:hypothetical protein